MTTKTETTFHELREAGFDRCISVEHEHVRVGCSQCQALVINGVATHEHGCPNARRKPTEAFYEDEGD